MDLILPLVDEIILMKESKIISHGAKEEVINSKEFEMLNINKPKIFSIFNELKNRNQFQKNIPVSIQEAINLLKGVNSSKSI
jgi:hypothetical protein